MASDGTSLHSDIDNVVESPSFVSRSTSLTVERCKKPREWSEAETEELIRLWSDRPVLFNARHPDYAKGERRKIAIAEISDKINIPPADINRKMENLRTYFGRERAKTLASQKNSISSDGVYKSRWVYFNPLRFLEDHLTPRKSSFSSFNDKEKDRRNGDKKHDINEIRGEPHVYVVENDCSHRPKKRKSEDRKIEDRAEELIKMAIQILKSPGTNSCPRQPDMIFAEYVGHSLQNIIDERVKEVVKIKIMELIFNARFSQQSAHETLPFTSSGVDGPSDNSPLATSCPSFLSNEKIYHPKWQSVDRSNSPHQSPGSSGGDSDHNGDVY